MVVNFLVCLSDREMVIVVLCFKGGVVSNGGERWARKPLCLTFEQEMRGGGGQESSSISCSYEGGERVGGSVGQ